MLKLRFIKQVTQNSFVVKKIKIKIIAIEKNKVWIIIIEIIKNEIINIKTQIKELNYFSLFYVSQTNVKT